MGYLGVGVMLGKFDRKDLDLELAGEVYPGVELIEVETFGGNQAHSI